MNGGFGKPGERIGREGYLGKDSDSKKPDVHNSGKNWDRYRERYPGTDEPGSRWLRPDIPIPESTTSMPDEMSFTEAMRLMAQIKRDREEQERRQRHADALRSETDIDGSALLAEEEWGTEEMRDITILVIGGPAHGTIIPVDPGKPAPRRLNIPVPPEIRVTDYSRNDPTSVYARGESSYSYSPDMKIEYYEESDLADEFGRIIYHQCTYSPGEKGGGWVNSCICEERASDWNEEDQRKKSDAARAQALADESSWNPIGPGTHASRKRSDRWTMTTPTGESVFTENAFASFREAVEAMPGNAQDSARPFRPLGPFGPFRPFRNLAGATAEIKVSLADNQEAFDNLRRAFGGIAAENMGIEDESAPE